MTQPIWDGDVDSVDAVNVNAFGSPLEPSESLDSDDLGSTDRGHDPLDDGWDPPDRLSPGERFGTTPEEQRAGESLDSLLAQEQPEPDPYAEAARLESGEVLEFDVYASTDDSVEPPVGLDTDLEQDPFTLLADDEGVRSVTTGELIAHETVTDRRRGSPEEPLERAPEEAALHIHSGEHRA